MKMTIDDLRNLLVENNISYISTDVGGFYIPDIDMCAHVTDKLFRPICLTQIGVVKNYVSKKKFVEMVKGAGA